MLYEIHVHSKFSDGNASPKQIVDHAKKIGLNGIAITDHDEIAGSLEALNYATEDFTVIPGMEVSAREGHILALNVRELIPKDLSAKETIDRIHALGGLAVAAHPYDSWRNGVGDLVLELDFDAVEVANGHTIYNTKDVVGLCGKHGLVMVGGTDAHLLKEVGSVVVECDKPLLEAIKSGALRIKSSGKPQLFSNHALFLFHRKVVRRLIRALGWIRSRL